MTVTSSLAIGGVASLSCFNLAGLEGEVSVSCAWPVGSFFLDGDFAACFLEGVAPDLGAKSDNLKNTRYNNCWLFSRVSTFH